MKSYYRNRIMIAFLLSFFILLILAMTGIWLFSYIQMEQETGDFVRVMQEIQEGDEPPSSRQQAPPPMFGYVPGPLMYTSGFYDILVGEDGEIRNIRQMGITEKAGEDLQQTISRAVVDKRQNGKTGSFKYNIVYREDGTARAIVLDMSIQLQDLYKILKSSLIVGLILMGLWFVILLPVSSKVADIFVRNAEEQKRFITDAGHDLKTPVAIIRSNLDVMELLQGQNKWSENIRSQVNRLEYLVKQLVMLSRLDETGVSSPVEQTDMTKLIREEWKSYLPVFEEKGITCTLEMSESIQLKGHEKALRQLLDLLLDNSVQYTNENGAVTLNAGLVKRKLQLTLTNTVSQLPVQKPEELTQRFVRGNTARTQKTGGSGIGLSAVQRIVRMHGGSLRISYPTEDSFRVFIELPQ